MDLHLEEKAFRKENRAVLVNPRKVKNFYTIYVPYFTLSRILFLFIFFLSVQFFFFPGLTRDSISHADSSQASSASSIRRGLPAGLAGPGRGRCSSSIGTGRFSLPTVLDTQESVDSDYPNDQYEAATIDASSVISERKRRRRGKQKRGSARPAGPGRGHKTIYGEREFPFAVCFTFLDPTPLVLLDEENSIRDELQSESEDEDQEPIPRRPPSARIAARQEKDRQERERLNFERMPRPEPVTERCWQKHPGLGCAAKDANHIPDYYNSLEPVFFFFVFSAFNFNF